MKRIGLLLLVCLAAAALASAASEPRDVNFTAPDGISLKATYFSAGKPGPGILLLHMCNSQRKAWADFATQLSAQGFHVLTLDYRGFGESGGDRFQELPNDRRPAEQAKWAGDIDAAFAYLQAQPGVDAKRIGAAGASCGVNQSIQLARRHPEVKSLVLLSGATDRAGREYLRGSTWLPVFGSASEDDGDAVPLMRWLLAFSRNSGNRLVVYKTAGHGTDMFAVEKGLEPALVEWFEKTLRNALPTASTSSAAASAKPSPMEEFWAVLDQPKGAARAMQLFAEAKKPDPSAFLFPEGPVNLLGYERLQAGDAAEAIEVFKLNVDAYPNSANVYDSLADAYVAAGNNELALQFTQKTLEMLAKNPPANPQLADAIRQSAEGKLRRLRQPGGAGKS